MITLNERVEERTVKLSVALFNPSMALAHNVLTSRAEKNRNKKLCIEALDSGIVLMFIHDYAFMSERGGNDTNEMHKAKSVHRLGPK